MTRVQPSREADIERDATGRFDATREAIITCASEVLSESTAKGMTLKEVASRVGLKTSSITYYFPRKDALLTACLERTVARHRTLLDQAAQEATPALRVRALLWGVFERLGKLMRGEEQHLATLAHIPSLPEPDRSRILHEWRDIFRRVRSMIEPPNPDPALHDLYSAQAHVILDIQLSLNMWASTFDVDQHQRLFERLSDIIINGIAAGHSGWNPMQIAPKSIIPDAHDLPDFFRVATRMINERGYRGASISNIAAEINLTKGSFYHHLATKDDLVIACFDRSFEILSAAYKRTAGAANSWDRLVSTAAALVDFQFSPDGPLLRFSAMSALPQQAEAVMAERSIASARRFEGLISDCIAEGSARPVDAFIASQALLAVINGAGDFINWSRSMERSRAIELYCSILFYGLDGKA